MFFRLRCFNKSGQSSCLNLSNNDWKEYKKCTSPKYAAPLSEGGSTVLMAALLGRLLEKCMAGEGLLAQMIVDKYLDHLPIHRQPQRYQRMGVTIAQSTSNDWFRTVMNHLHALYEAHKRITLATSYLGADETPIKVLDEDKKGTTHRGSSTEDQALRYCIVWRMPEESSMKPYRMISLVPNTHMDCSSNSML